MIDEELALLRAHRNNINRYQRLLETGLTELERQFIERRLAEERSAVQRLAASALPLAFKTPNWVFENASAVMTASSHGSP
jgi:hypothetical protein